MMKTPPTRWMAQKTSKDIKKHIYKAKKKFEWKEITMEEVKEACRGAVKKAAGLYGWRPEEFSVLLYEIYQPLADLMNVIVREKRWPKAQHTARSCFLSKDRSGTEGPLKCRKLNIANGLQKICNCIVKTLKPWNADWDLAEMNAGSLYKVSENGKW